MSFILRPATEADQDTIKNIIRKARIYPLGLKWQRFIVAEDEGEIVGVGQVKPHLWGANELASIAVIPERRKEGIAAKIIETLLERETGNVYLNCHSSLERFYEQFGFRRLTWQQMPFVFKGVKAFLFLITPLGRIVTQNNFHILIMGRENRL
jgi:N-acetylglutamate synthase-like GNAT family acetyltransferase